MSALTLSRVPPNEHNQPGKAPRVGNRLLRQGEKMIAIAGDDDALLTLGEIENARILRRGRQNFPQASHVVLPISEQLLDFIWHVVVQQELHNVSLICSATNASIAVR